MTTIDTSGVDRMEVRQRLAEQEAARNAIVDAIAAAHEPFLARIRVIEKEMEAATAALEDKLSAHDEATEADDDLADGFDEDGNPHRCCVSGLVLLEGDLFVRDADGNKALRAVLPRWPAPIDGESEDEESEEDAA